MNIYIYFTYLYIYIYFTYLCYYKKSELTLAMVVEL